MLTAISPQQKPNYKIQVQQQNGKPKLVESTQC